MARGRYRELDRILKIHPSDMIPVVTRNRKLGQRCLQIRIILLLWSGVSQPRSKRITEMCSPGYPAATPKQPWQNVLLFPEDSLCWNGKNGYFSSKKGCGISLCCQGYTLFNMVTTVLLNAKPLFPNCCHHCTVF